MADLAQHAYGGVGVIAVIPILVGRECSSQNAHRRPAEFIHEGPLYRIRTIDRSSSAPLQIRQPIGIDAMALAELIPSPPPQWLEGASSAEQCDPNDRALQCDRRLWQQPSQGRRAIFPQRASSGGAFTGDQSA